MAAKPGQQRGRERWRAAGKPGRQPSRLGRWWSRPADLQPVRRGPLSLQAADQIRRRIVLGDLRPRQRLEPQRVLAQELGVSLPVVREAIAALSYVGLLEVRHGIGVFVARRHRRARVLRVSRRRAGRREVSELRRALEPAVARAAAAAKVTPMRQAEVRLALNERLLAMHSGDADRFTDADLLFHETVAQASGNALGVSIHRMAAVAIRRDLGAQASRLAHDERLARLHEALATAVEAGRIATAGRAAGAIAAIESARPP